MESKRQRLARIEPDVTNHNDSNNSPPLPPTRPPTIVSDAYAPTDGELHNINNGHSNPDDFFDSLPPGYRFRPTEEELIIYYLMKKVKNEKLPPNRMAEVDIYQYDPEVICGKYRSLGEQEWYFFSPRERKYPNGIRPKRSTPDGFWKVSGSDKFINSKGSLVGRWNTLVYYEGKAPSGTRTDWIMREYLLDGHSHQRISAADMTLDDFVLCKLYKKADTNGKRKKKEKEVENSEPSDTIIPPSYDQSCPDIPPSNEYGPLWSEIPHQLQCDTNNIAASTAESDDHMASNKLLPPDLRTFPEIESAGLMATKNIVASTAASDDHMALNKPPSLEDITPEVSAGLMGEPPNGYVHSLEGIIHSNNNGATTIGSESMMVEPIRFNPPPSGFTQSANQCYNQEDLSWNSLADLDFENFVSPLLLDPIYYNYFDGELMPWNNLSNKNPPK